MSDTPNWKLKFSLRVGEEIWIEAGFVEKLERELAEARACIRGLVEVGDEMSHWQDGCAQWTWAKGKHDLVINAAMEETK